MLIKFQVETPVRQGYQSHFPIVSLNVRLSNNLKLEHLSVSLYRNIYVVYTSSFTCLMYDEVGVSN